MDLQTEIKRVDERIAKSGFSIAEVCRKANIQQSSYTRWRRFAEDPEGLAGTEPRVSSLKKVEKALNILIAEALK